MQNIETVGALNDSDRKRWTGRNDLGAGSVTGKEDCGDCGTDRGQIRKVKFILIAGPSSSGKTTFSHRLSVQLKANGMVPHPISVDNYLCRTRRYTDRCGWKV